MTRQDWDFYFMDIAHQVKTRSTCIRRQVGAVIVKDRNILSTGYNGSPKNTNHCEDVGCIRQQMNIPSGQRHELCRAVHAEQNAIIQARESLEGATIYVTASPCSLCAKMLINAGVKRIVADSIYLDELSTTLLREADVDIQILVKGKGDKNET